MYKSNVYFEANCGGDLSAENGVITSPKYPQEYELNTDCLWHITVTSGFKVVAVFTDFKV